MEPASFALAATTLGVQAARGAQGWSDSRRDQKGLGRRIRSVSHLAVRVHNRIRDVQIEEYRHELPLLPRDLPRHTDRLIRFTEAELDRIDLFNMRYKDSGSFRFWLWVRKSLGRDHLAENLAVVESCERWLNIVDWTVILCRERRLGELRIEYPKSNTSRNLQYALFDRLQEAKDRKSMRAHRLCREKMRQHGVRTNKIESYSVYVLDDIESNASVLNLPRPASRRRNARLSPLEKRRPPRIEANHERRDNGLTVSWADAGSRRHERDIIPPAVAFGQETRGQSSLRPSSRRLPQSRDSRRYGESDVPGNADEREAGEWRRSSRPSQRRSLSPEGLWRDHVTSVMRHDPSAGRIGRPLPAQGVPYPLLPPSRGTSDSGYGESVPPTPRHAHATPAHEPPAFRMPSSRRPSVSRERGRGSSNSRRRSASRETPPRAAAEHRDVSAQGSRGAKSYPPIVRGAPREDQGTRPRRKRETSIGGDSGFSEGETSRRSSHSERRSSRVEQRGWAGQ